MTLRPDRFNSIPNGAGFGSRAYLERDSRKNLDQRSLEPNSGLSMQNIYNPIPANKKSPFNPPIEQLEQARRISNYDPRMKIKNQF